MTTRRHSAGKTGPKIITFIGAGFLNTAFGYLVYAALIYIGLQYFVALLVATVAGIIFNYYSYGLMVFDGVGGRSVFFKFIVAYGFLYAVNAALLDVLMNGWLKNPYSAQAICVPLSVCLSWLIMNKWVYK